MGSFNAALSTSQHIRVVAEEFEVVRIQLLDSAQLLGADLRQNLRRYLRRLPGPAVVRVRDGEADAVCDSEHSEDCLRILVQRLVVSDEVVADVARVTEPVLLAPVVVRQQVILLACGPRIQQVLHHLAESDVVTSPQRLFAGVGAAHCAHDATAEALRVVVGRLGELVSVRGHETLERVTNEQELEVSR